MKIQFQKDILPHLLGIAFFYLLVVGYFSPLVFDGQIIFQGDILQWEGSAKEVLDYRAATGQVINVPSEWHAWLDKQLSRDLKHEIIKRNRLDQSMRMPDGNTRRRFDAFMQGTSDLL